MAGKKKKGAAHSSWPAPTLEPAQCAIAKDLLETTLKWQKLNADETIPPHTRDALGQLLQGLANLVTTTRDDEATAEIRRSQARFDEIAKIMG